MSLFMKKFVAALVAVITFGVITPSHEIWNSVFDTSSSAYSATVMEQVEVPLELLIADAEYQSEVKFGSKITPKIKARYEAEIFPIYRQKIEEIATSTSAISSKPSGEYGEKIFHLYDRDSQKDMLRAHVRVEKRPKEGYYFTFHYHLADDEFQSHRDIGEIYWSKNTPPKWLS